MNIQKFAKILSEYENMVRDSIAEHETEIGKLQGEQTQQLNDYNTNYNNQINQFNDLMEQEKQNLINQTNTQKELQQKQTNYNIDLINQNKKEAEKESEKQVKDAYIDYMKQTNEVGGALENLASRGLATQGYAESSKVAMYNTYQNRTATTKAALLKANTDFDNQINQALLNNDSALAELSLNQMNKMYEIAFKGYEFTNNMWREKLSYEQDLKEYYTQRKDTLQNRIANYKNALGNIEQQRVDYDKWKIESDRAYEQKKLDRELEMKRFQESIRQFNARLAEDKRQFNSRNEAEKFDDEFDDNKKNNDDVIRKPKQFGDLINQFSAQNIFGAKLISGKGATWVKNNLNPYTYRNGIKQSELEKKLQSAYKQKILTSSEINQILEAYGVN